VLRSSEPLFYLYTLAVETLCAPIHFLLWRRTLRDKEKAVFYFESYLNHAPHADDRAEAEEHITHLRREIAQKKQEKAQGERAMTSAPPLLPTPREAKPFYQRWWFWTVVGGVVATAAATAITIASQPADPVRGTFDPGQVQLQLRP
jgi:hypothetical protein